tara:strand:+ start:1786 stop:2493 length:708 start_codon:yes stop_codon:yes gene_type:complete
MIYCFDVDGTICTTRNGDYQNATPFIDVVEKINRLYGLGHTIKIMTARGCVSGKDWTEVTKKQLKDWGIKYHELIPMKTKPHADFFVDDKAININDFRGLPVVGFIAGTFDLMHVGYARLFTEALSVCNHLVVALHTDPSIERPDIKKKPIHSVEERIEILRCLKGVKDIRTYETEKDLFNLIRDVKPDVRIIGSDYKDTDKIITGKGFCKSIHYHERNHDYSYTSLREKAMCNA